MKGPTPALQGQEDTVCEITSPEHPQNKDKRGMWGHKVLGQSSQAIQSSDQSGQRMADSDQREGPDFRLSFALDVGYMVTIRSSRAQ